LVKFEDGSCPVKNKVTGAKNRKILLTLLAAVLIQIFWKFVRKVVLMISRSSSKMDHVQSKTRPQELKIEKAC
jgi:hypothetical protein